MNFVCPICIETSSKASNLGRHVTSSEYNQFLQRHLLSCPDSIVSEMCPVCHQGLQIELNKIGFNDLVLHRVGHFPAKFTCDVGVSGVRDLQHQQQQSSQMSQQLGGSSGSAGVDEMDLSEEIMESEGPTSRRSLELMSQREGEIDYDAVDFVDVAAPTTQAQSSEEVVEMQQNTDILGREALLSEPEIDPLQQILVEHPFEQRGGDDIQQAPLLESNQDMHILVVPSPTGDSNPWRAKFESLHRDDPRLRMTQSASDGESVSRLPPLADVPIEFHDWETVFGTKDTMTFCIEEYLLNGVSLGQAKRSLEIQKERLARLSPIAATNLPANIAEVYKLSHQLGHERPRTTMGKSPVYSVARILTMIASDIRHSSKMRFTYKKPTNNRMSEYYHTPGFRSLTENVPSDELPFIVNLYYDDFRKYRGKDGVCGEFCSEEGGVVFIEFPRIPFFFFFFFFLLTGR